MTGFAETTPDEVHKQLIVSGERLTSHANGKLELATVEELDILRGELQIGIRWDTEVTLHGCSHIVTQAYCSAFL